MEVYGKSGNSLYSGILPGSSAASGNSNGNGGADAIFDEAQKIAEKNGKLTNKAKDIAGIIQAAGRM